MSAHRIFEVSGETLTGLEAPAAVLSGRAHIAGVKFEAELVEGLGLDIAIGASCFDLDGVLGSIWGVLNRDTEVVGELISFGGGWQLINLQELFIGQGSRESQDNQTTCE